MLAIEKLNQFYGESHTLWDLDLDVPAGQCTCVMGRNGVGKTTLMKAIMGEVAVKSGQLRYQGDGSEVELTKKAVEARSRLGIGFVPQGRQIFPLLTVEENLRTGLAARGDGLKKIPERIYELFPVLKEMKHRRGGDLSGGQQQQLAIGRALVIEPKLLILDEPGEGIQPNIVQLIRDVLLRLNKEKNMTIVLVEQKLPFARAVGEEFYLMERGKVVSHGEMPALTDELVKQYLSV